MIKKSHKKISASVLLTTFSIALVGLVLGSTLLASRTFADETGGGAGGGNGGGSEVVTGSCIDYLKNNYPGQYAQANPCGAAFQQFDTNNSGSWPNTSEDRAYIQSNVVPVCSKFGGKFYFLALARGTYSNGSVSYNGEIRRYRQVKNLVNGGGNVPYIAKAGLAYDDVLSKFNTAVNYAKAHKDDGDFSSLLSTPWSDVTWFCWNEGWASTSTESNFNAWSWVEDASTSPNPDSKVNITKTTSEKSVTVNFKHQLSYNRPAGDFSGSTFAGVSTNWNTVVTQDGQPVGINSSGTYSLPSGYPNDGASWSPFYGQSSYTINIPEGATNYSTTVCSTIYYNPKKISWKEVSSKKFEINSSNSNAESQACIIIKVSETDEETEDGGQIRFWSTSTVEVPSNQKGGDVSYHVETSSSDGNGKVTAKLSTDADTLDVNFWHTLFYKHESRGRSTMPSEPHSGQDKLLDDICTKYKIDQSGDANNANKSIEGETDFCVDKNSFTTNYQSSGKKVKQDKYNFKIENIGVGQTVTVCQKISFQPEIVTLTRTKKMKKVFDGYERVWAFDSETMSKDEMFIQNWGGFVPVGFDLLTDAWGNWAYTLDGYPMMNLEGIALYAKISADEIVPVYYAKYHEELDYYEYHKESEQGDGYSEACVEVTRPAGATKPGEGVDGPHSGNPDIGFMYTGETSDISWDVEAYHYNTRRLVGFDAIIYEPIVNIPFENAQNYVNGTIGHNPTRTNLSPCQWFSRYGGLRDNKCQVLYSQNSDGTPPLPTNDMQVYHINLPASIVVPDYVGDKYCNSFGFFWQYWYGVTKEVNGSVVSDTWSPESRTYWMNYDAACRTIVKKPSTSLWNGGLFTDGSVKTSLSTRYINPYFGQLSNSGDPKKFGSWTEYLAVVGNEVINNKFGFSSGAALGGNGSIANATLLDNSPLTIANTGNQDNKIGNSGISSNSTYRARLSSYLLKNITPSAAEEVNSLQNVEGIKIIYVDGDVNITAPRITVKDANYNTIYQLPQIVIYATGNINIGSSVEQIDAWLISGGTVNTCSNFANGSTEARVSGYNSGTDCSKQLTINGPIIAKNVIPNRSAGADPITYGVDGRVGGDARATSGEVFNLSADTYLWAYAQAGRYDSSYSEAYTRELPPRY